MKKWAVVWAIAGMLPTGVLHGAARVVATTARARPGGLMENGALLWRGKPFFPIGLYHVNHTDTEYALIAANGFNTIEGSFETDPAAFRKTLEMAARHGLAVDAPLFANSRVKENLEASMEKIRENRTNPAVLSWKLLDEPDADRNEKLRDEVRQEYLEIKELKPGQPLELTLSQDDTLGYWSRFCDVVQIDRYPVPGKPLTQVSVFCSEAVKAKEPWQNLTFVAQCGWTPDLKTQPTFAQARCMVYLALIAGAKGIFWYSRQEDDWDLTTSPLWPRMKEINAEIASVAGPLLSGTDVAGVTCSAPGVRFAAKRYVDEIYLLATNPMRAPVEADFAFPGGVRKHASLGAFGSEKIIFKQ